MVGSKSAVAATSREATGPVATKIANIKKFHTSHKIHFLIRLFCNNLFYFSMRVNLINFNIDNIVSEFND